MRLLNHFSPFFTCRTTGRSSHACWRPVTVTEAVLQPNWTTLRHCKTLWACCVAQWWANLARTAAWKHSSMLNLMCTYRKLAPTTKHSCRYSNCRRPFIFYLFSFRKTTKNKLPASISTWKLWMHKCQWNINCGCKY